jgi:hypothetical protein
LLRPCAWDLPRKISSEGGRLHTSRPCDNAEFTGLFFGTSRWRSLDCRKLSDKPFAAVGRDAGRKCETIALLCGPTNDRKRKCWPAEKWKKWAAELLRLFPTVQFQMFGSVRDRPMAEQIFRALRDERVVNLAGTTAVG